MSVLFIHNTIPEYRIPFFIGLKKKINVDYLFTNINLSREIYGIEDEDIKKLTYEYLPRNFKRITKLVRIIIQKNYESIILPPMDSIVDFLDCFIILIVGKIRKNKLLYFGEKWEAPREFQSTKKKLKNWLQRLAFKVILKRIDMCIVSGYKSYEYFENLGIHSECLCIARDSSGVNKIKNCIDIRKEKNINDNSKIILYYGRIIKRKGLEVLINAYKTLQMKYKNIYLIICGEGEYKEECIKLAKILNIKNIFFEGYINPKYKYVYFSQCDLFVLPSYFYNGIPEAWGLTVNEALQCGKPVIATDAVGAAYDLLNGKNGRMIRQNCSKELENALEDFLFRKMEKNVKEECINQYKKSNYENMITGFINALEKINCN